MTNQERAAQIVNAIVQEIPVLTSNRQRLLHKEIMLQLEEAVREAKTEWLSDEIRTGAQLQASISEEMRKVKFEEFKNQIYAEGFAAARENLHTVENCTQDLTKTYKRGFSDAQEECKKYHISLTENHYLKGFNEAREKAAGIAAKNMIGYQEDQSEVTLAIHNTARFIAERIRAMEMGDENEHI